MHDDGLGTRLPPSLRDPIDEVRPVPVLARDQDGERRRVPAAVHREDVLRRLLRRGLSARSLKALLPEFRALIDRLTRA